MVAQGAQEIWGKYPPTSVSCPEVEEMWYFIAALFSILHVHINTDVLRRDSQMDWAGYLFNARLNGVKQGAGLYMLLDRGEGVQDM